MRNFSGLDPQQTFSIESFQKKEKILIACSGGPDSVALCYLLKSLQATASFDFGIAHFNHQLRGNEAKKDALFVKKLADAFGVPFYLGTAPVKKEAAKNKTSLEEAGRKLRYQFLVKTAKEHRYKKVLLAHNLDDQAETILMRMIQGTGIRGLCGIRKSLVIEGVPFCRPLLQTKKRQILAFLKAHKIAYCKDASNRSVKFLRNKIRLQLMPYLEKEFNPRVLEALARIPQVIEDESEALEIYQNKAWKEILLKKGTRQIVFKEDLFFTAPSAVQFFLIDKALKKLHPESGLSFEAWQRVRLGISKKSGQWTLPKNILLSVNSSRIILKSEKS